MNKNTIIENLKNFAPIDLAQDWDCVGYMAQTNNQNIHKVMLCLTPTEDVIKQALSQNCDMIVAHHPMFEVKLDSALIDENGKPRLDIYSAHTNLDITQGGTTDTLVSFVCKYLKNYKTESDNIFVRYVILDKLYDIKALGQILRKISPNLRLVNNFNQNTVKKIGFCAGSGSEFIRLAQEDGADCFVSGDLKFHTALECQIPVFDIGHFESEILILPVLKQVIGDEVEIVYAKERSPFVY